MIAFFAKVMYNTNGIRMWLSLVERLLWEQDAAGSNPVIRTTQRELPLVGGSLCFSVVGSILRLVLLNILLPPVKTKPKGVVLWTDKNL